MAISCGHQQKEFKNQNPSDTEINEYRLWKCPDCNKWFSLLIGG